MPEDEASGSASSASSSRRTVADARVWGVVVVSVLNDGRKLEILTVLLRQGRNIEFGIGQVDAFLCTKFGSSLGGASDFYFEPGFAAFFVDRSDDTLNSCHRRRKFAH